MGLCFRKTDERGYKRTKNREGACMLAIQYVDQCMSIRVMVGVEKKGLLGKCRSKQFYGGIYCRRCG